MPDIYEKRYIVRSAEHIMTGKEIWVIYDTNDSSAYNWYNSENEAIDRCNILNSVESLSDSGFQSTEHCRYCREIIIDGGWEGCCPSCYRKHCR